MTVEEFLGDDPDRSCWWGACPRPATMLAWAWCHACQRWEQAAVCAAHPMTYALAV